MKYISLLLSACILFGCGKNNSQNIAEVPTELELPAYIVIQSSSGSTIGTLIENTIVTHDQLLQEDILPWNNQDFNVEARDFENDLAYLTLPTQPQKKQSLKPTNPIIGSTLYWINGSQNPHAGIVQKIAPTTNSNGKTLITVSGVDGYNSMGSPLFNHRGEVMGIIIGANPTNKTIEALRLEEVLEFIQNNT